ERRLGSKVHFFRPHVDNKIRTHYNRGVRRRATRSQRCAMQFLWDDDPEEVNLTHIAEHGLTPEDVEHAFQNVLRRTTSRSSGRPALFGLAPDDRVLFVVCEEVDEGLIYV